MSLKGDVLDTLREVKNEKVKPARGYGLCSILRTRLNVHSAMAIDTLLQKYIVTWKHYSGDDTFPVPSTNKRYTAMHYYLWNVGNLWRGKQGVLRQSLIDHLISCLEKEDETGK